MKSFKKGIPKIIVILGINYLLLELFSLTLIYLGGGRFKYKAIDSFSKIQLKSIKNFSKKDFGFIKFDSLLGWDNNINKLARDDMGPFNSDGLRSDRDYSIKIPKKTLRITTFGDSFTYGAEVENSETFQSQMEAMDKGLEVLNFGVTGYGLDQAYLRFKNKGKKYETDFVFIGFMTENINRNRNRFRPFYFTGTGLPFSKPKFNLKDQSLVLVPSYFKSPEQYQKLLEDKPNTIRLLGRDDFYFSVGPISNPLTDWSPSLRLFKATKRQLMLKNNMPYNKNSIALKVTKKLFDNFYSEVQNLNQIPIIVIFPNEVDLDRCKASQNKNHSPLLEYFQSKDYLYTDLTDLLCKYNTKDMISGHYTPLGNKVVSEFMFKYIKGISSFQFIERK